MKTLLAFLLLCCCALPSLAAGQFLKDEDEVGILDGHRATRIWWKGGGVASSEELWAGRTLKGFPLAHLLDGDPRTAWAYSGTGQGWKRAGWRGQYALSFGVGDVGKPVAMDSLRIMNGYNRRRDLFERNDRVVEMQIWLSDRLQKTVRLSDTMGWHTVSFPNQEVRKVGLLFTGIRKGSGADHDVCISEVAFFDGGRKVNLQMPNVVMFDAGNQSGDAPLDYKLITRDGKVVTQGQEGNVPSTWSFDNKYLAGVWGTTDPRLLWVVDVDRARLVSRRFLPKADDFETPSVYWAEDHILEVRLETDFDFHNRAQMRRYRYKINVS